MSEAEDAGWRRAGAGADVFRRPARVSPGFPFTPLPDDPPSGAPLRLDESAAIARAAAGDHEAFLELFARHSGPLQATLRARLASREDAREILQETWLRAWEHLARLRDPRELHAWLVTIALNLARARRRRGREQSVAPEELEPPVHDAGPERLGEVEELARLRAGMAALPARQREVLDLRVNHGLTHADIARVLAISEEASRASYYQGLRRLKAALGPGEDER